MRLMRRVTVAAVNSVALYGAEVWWRGQQDRLKRIQLLLNSQARAITGMLPSTPIPALLEAASLPRAQDLLDYRQTRYAMRALAAPRDHPTHQLLPANFRVGQLYRHEGARGYLSSDGWLRPDKTHRRLGGRLAQQVAKLVTYDTEYGFSLLERLRRPEPAIEIRIDYPDNAAQRMSEGQPDQLTLFACGVASSEEGTNLGAGIAWRENGCWKTKTTPLGKYLTAIDADLFAIDMAAKEGDLLLSKTGKLKAEIVSTSRKALTTLSRTGQWVPPLVKEIAEQAKQSRTKGYKLTLSGRPTNGDVGGVASAEAAARRATRQQPRQMRSASLSYVQQSVKARWQQSPKLNKHIGDGNKSVTARYLQLKSGHAMTGVHLLRSKQSQDARCWWCTNSRQSVVHIMLKCRKWRREREKMIDALEAKKIKISTERNEQDLLILFDEPAVEMVLRFIEGTSVGKKRESGDVQRLDGWDVDLLDRDDEGGLSSTDE